MNTHTTLIAATLAVAGLSAAPAFAQQAAVDAAQQGVGTTAQQAGSDANGAADSPADSMQNMQNKPMAGDATAGGGMAAGTAPSPDANENALGVLQTSTEAALTNGGFDDLVERFVDADRNRIGQSPATDAELARLNQLVDKLQKAWEAKYGGEFEIDDRLAVFDNRYKVTFGEIGGNGATPSNTPGQAIPAAAPINPADRPGVTDPAGPAMVGPNGATPNRVDPNAANPALTDTVGGAGSTGRTNDAEDANREPGRNVATVVVPAGSGEGAITVPLVYEFPGVYKIDAPDSLTGPTLAANLTRQLQALYDARAQWPADEQQAYRAVSGRVLAAIFNDQAAPMNGAATPKPQAPANDGM